LLNVAVEKYSAKLVRADRAGGREERHIRAHADAGEGRRHDYPIDF
jgi:hypothetical protein